VENKNFVRLFDRGSGKNVSLTAYILCDSRRMGCSIRIVGADPSVKMMCSDQASDAVGWTGRA
jgi:hypothetical protein